VLPRTAAGCAVAATAPRSNASVSWSQRSERSARSTCRVTPGGGDLRRVGRAACVCVCVCVWCEEGGGGGVERHEWGW
jgi:hypothetical protein